jgi:hypothetical protein
VDSYQVVEALITNRIPIAAALGISILLIAITLKINNYLWRKLLVKNHIAVYQTIRDKGDVKFIILNLNGIDYYLSSLSSLNGKLPALGDNDKLKSNIDNLNIILYLKY